MITDLSRPRRTARACVADLGIGSDRLGQQHGISFERLPFEPAAWDRVVDGLGDAEVYHSSAWLQYLRATQSVEPVTAQVSRDGQPIGYLVGAITRKYGVRIFGSPFVGWGTPRMGFVGVPHEELPATASALLRYSFGPLRCQQIELAGSGIIPETVTGLGFAVEKGRSFAVDLSGSESDVFGRMSSTTRNLARRAAKDGLIVEHVTDDSIAVDYHQQMTDVFASQGLAPPYPIARVRALVEHLAPSGQLMCIRVRAPDGMSVATLVTVGRNQTAVLWGAAVLREHATLHPNEVMHWEAIRYWHQRGARWYDMGGGGDYKRKYGAAEEPWYHFRRSRFPGLDLGRSVARSVVAWQQRVHGRAVANATKGPATRPEA